MLTVVTGAGALHPIASGLWHGGVVYGLTGVAGMVSKSRKHAGLTVPGPRYPGRSGSAVGSETARSADRRIE